MTRVCLAALSFAIAGCSLITKLDGLGGDAQAPTDASTEQPACGTVGNACCAPNTCAGGATCTQNVCTCASPTKACGAACINLEDDTKNCGACGHSCLGGVCKAGVCQPVVLATGQGIVRAITVTATKVLWARATSAFVDGGLFAADLNGQNIATLYDAKKNPCAAVTATETEAYFYCTPNLMRCSLPSCADATVVAAVPNVTRVALDAQNGRLYFTVRTVYNTQTGGFVGSVPITGGAAARLVPADQPNPADIRIVGGTVYWLNSGTYANDVGQKNGGVRKAPIGINQTESTVVTDLSGNDYVGLAVDGNTLYYGAGSAHEIHATSIVGGSASTFAKVPDNPSAVVADSTFVYFTVTGVGGGMSRCEKTCVNPTGLAPGDAIDLAQDAASLYWATAGGEIRRLAK